MAKKYQIWNKTDKIITPIGEILTPEQWIERYPMAAILDIIIGGGTINGTVCMEYTQTIDMYASMGVDFSGCETQQDHLDAIEAWENEQAALAAEPGISDQTRIADALQDLVILNMPDMED